MTKLMFYSTLDIDTNNKEFNLRLTMKILRCPHIERLYVKPSNSKGIHYKIYCDVDCFICRWVFDDQKRFSYDSYRKPEFRNILFDVSEDIQC